MKKSDSLDYDLSTKKVIFLFIYYVLILISGIFCSVIVITNLKSEFTIEQLIKYTILISFSMSTMLCSIQYIRRLYKACIDERIKNTTSHGEIGNLIYFLLRPVFALVFTIVMIVSLLSGMFIVTGSLDYIINEKFLYLCAILSSFIGFSPGRLLDKFETIAEKEIDKI
ncbi:hypothetical protein J6Y50_06800 [bacterium]|nr:hypothetical protein [bacterium]